jgi:hypothetical protein
MTSQWRGGGGVTRAVSTGSILCRLFMPKAGRSRRDQVHTVHSFRCKHSRGRLLPYPSSRAPCTEQACPGLFTTAMNCWTALPGGGGGDGAGGVGAGGSNPVIQTAPLDHEILLQLAAIVPTSLL